MRKIFVSLFVISCIMLNSIAISYANPTNEFRLFVTNASAQAGDTVSISVNMFAPGAFGANFYVEFDTTQLEYLSSDLSLGARSVMMSEGSLLVAFAGTRPINNQETVITVTFRVNSNYRGESIEVALAGVGVYDGDGENINVTATNGNISIMGGGTGNVVGDGLAVALLLNSPNAIIGNPHSLEQGRLTSVDSQSHDITPISVDGRTLIPVGFLVEAFGGVTEWDASTQTVTINTSNNRIVRLEIGSNIMDVNGHLVTLDVPAQMINGRTFLPLRAFVESALDKSLFFDSRGLIVISDYDDLLAGNERVIQALITRLDANVRQLLPNIATFTGSLSANGEVIEFIYVAPRSGVFNFQMLAGSAGNFEVILNDRRGGRITSGWRNNHAFSQHLNEGQEYRIIVRQHRGYLDFTINIHIPTVTHVTGTRISNTLERNEQVNVYTFIAPITGIYNFQMLADVAGNFEVILNDRRGGRITSGWRNNHAFSQHLNEGQEYQIVVRQHRGYLDYTINIHLPTVTQVTGTRIFNTLERNGQVNTYTFVAPITGIYNFQLLADVAGNYEVIINDSRGSRLTSGWRNNHAFSITLNEGQEYQIVVRQHRGYLDYTINIHLPTITQVTGTRISGTLERNEQVDVYAFTVPTSGLFSFDLSSDVSGNYEVILFDENGTRLTSGWLNNRSFSRNLTAGQRIFIHVRQHRGYLDYTIDISW